jgi:zinc transporter 5/7
MSADSQGNHHGHGHGHSFSASHLSPASANTKNSFSGHNVRKAASNGNILYTHDETSRENSPYPSPEHEHDRSNAFKANIDAVHANGHNHTHDHSHSGHTHSHSHSGSMKGRARGESDLGRNDVNISTYAPTLSDLPVASSSWFSLPEALTALLVPLPYLLASAAYSSNDDSTTEDGFPPLSAYAKLQQSVLTSTSDLPSKALPKPSGFVEACQLASGTLLLVGILAKVRAHERTLDRRKEQGAVRQAHVALDISTLKSIVTRSMSVGLPFYAAMKLGGMRTGLVLLVAIAANLTCTDSLKKPSMSQWAQQAMSTKFTMAAILISAFLDFAGLTIHTSTADLLLGYLSLAIAVTCLNPPLPTPSGPSSRPSARIVSSSAPRSLTWNASSLTCSTGDVNLTLLSGGVLSFVTIASSVVIGKSPSLVPTSVILSTLSIASATAANLFAQPASLRSPAKAGLGLGCLLTASCAFLFSPALWPGTICNGGLSALGFAGVIFDTSSSSSSGDHSHDHDHAHNVNTRHHHPAEGQYSPFTKLVLSNCEPGSLVHSIIIEKDSRRICYFTWYVVFRQIRILQIISNTFTVSTSHSCLFKACTAT